MPVVRGTTAISNEVGLLSQSEQPLCHAVRKDSMRNTSTSLIAFCRKHEWAFVGYVAATAFVLGLVGLHRHQQFDQTVWSWPDAFYFVLRLFTFELDLSNSDTETGKSASSMRGR